MLSPKAKNQSKFRATLAEIWSRIINKVESDDYYTNGDDDRYSRTIEGVIMNSPTASRAVDAMAKYIAGKGLTADVTLYDDISLFDVVNEIAQDIAFQGGCFIHRSLKYDLDSEKFITDKIEVLDYHRMRIGIEDDAENAGKFWDGDFGGEKKGWSAKKDKEFYYPFSTNQRVIQAQIEADAKESTVETIADKLRIYRGQVMYLNTTPRFIYSISPMDAVFNDMDTEYRIGLYSNKVVRSGFLGKKVILFKELDEPINDPEIQILESENDKVKRLVQEWMGAENSDSVMVVSVDNMTEPDKFMHIIDIPSDYNDDMFKETIGRVRRNILGGASNLPEALLFTNDGGLFSGSGEQFIQMKKFYSEQTEKYRLMIEKALLRFGFDTKIIELSDGDEVFTAE